MQQFLRWVIITLYFATRGQCSPLLFLDLRQDHIAMSSEIHEDISNMQTTVYEDVLEVQKENRINCFPFSTKLEYPNDKESDKSKECIKQGCTWYPRGSGKNWQSYCFTPRNYGYIMEGEPKRTNNGYVVQLVKSGKMTYFGNDAAKLTLTIEFQSDYRLHFKITDGSPRWEVPLKIKPAEGKAENPLYHIAFINDPVFALKIVRKSSGVVIFDTSLGGLTFSDQFIQISAKLPSKNIYGLGEHQQASFRHNFEGSPVWAMYSREVDNYIPSSNLGGVHPQYTVLENDGNVHSVMIVNSNAQEVELLPVPGIIYRTIGGVLDFYFFLGPKPEQAVQQLTEAVGRPFLPPYWALGFHLSRFPYSSTDSIKEAVDRMEMNEIPFDVVHADIGILDNFKSFTYSKNNFSGLPDYIKELQSRGIQLTVTVEPFVSSEVKNNSSFEPLNLGNELDVWVKDSEGNPTDGWNKYKIQYPDFFKNSTKYYWERLLSNYRDSLKFNGVHLNRNQPYSNSSASKSCASNMWNNPPYLPISDIQRSLANGSICVDSNQEVGLHYNSHSIYGWKQSQITFEAMKEITEKRNVITSKSTYLGSGQWVGHIFDDKDNGDKWWTLHQSIIQMLQYNQFGIPFVGANICSFGNKVSEELCLRGNQLGSFYPLARNYNENLPESDSEPASFTQEFAAGIKRALEIRYTLLPYLYTLFYHANTKGNTVVRPLWHEFSKDANTVDIDSQFMWGGGLLISPVLEEGANSVEVYIPRDRWYNYHNGSELTERGQYIVLDAPLDIIPVLVRGYHVIPTQQPAMNTKLSRSNNITLIVALCGKGNAKGQLYFDDGYSSDTIENKNYFLAQYSVKNKTFDAVVENDGYPKVSSLFLSSIRLLGAGDVQSITVNGENYSNWRATPNSAEVMIKHLNLPINSNYTIKWTRPATLV